MKDAVGELLWIGFEGTTAPEDLLARVASGQVGAVILFARNLARQADGERLDLEAVAQLNAAIHAANPACLIAVDQEGGVVQRVRAPATRWPPMARLATQPPERAYEVGLAMGRELKALGFDIDFAPVLDVHTNPANPIIGDRAFATTATDVIARALPFARGLHDAGVLPCGKHFPGHGDTTTDSHLTLPRIDHEMARLVEVELAPFAAAAHAELPMIMTAHVVFSALDATRPATLAPTVVRGLLREQLGYRGVIVSDDLDMAAIAANYDVGEAAIAAIEAGCDVLLLCRNPDHQMRVEAALRARVVHSAPFAALVAAAAARVRALKTRYRAMGAMVPHDVLGCAAHQQLAAELG